jgi:hypothetical protein
MKRNIWVFGTIAGIISCSWLLAFAIDGKFDFDKGEIIGYTTMIVAFSLIFVAVKNYRDKYNGGFVSFGKAFKLGFFVTLVASTIYCLVWLITSYTLMPDFAEAYQQYMLDQMKAQGASADAIARKTEEMVSFRDIYANPVIRFFITYIEILPVGLLVSLLAALLLKKRTPRNTAQAVANS